MMPSFGSHQCLVGHAGQVLPPGGVQSEELPYRRLVFGGWLVLIRTHRLPEALDEAGVVGVAALADDRRDRRRVVQRQTPADRRTVVLHIDRVPVDAEALEQALGQ